MLVPPLLFGGAWLTWFYRALVLLVIACPCALVISTPVSIVSGLTALARRGVLIKGGALLEAVGKLRALAVDKTGTITEGKPRVTQVVAIERDGRKRDPAHRRGHRHALRASAGRKPSSRVPRTRSVDVRAQRELPGRRPDAAPRRSSTGIRISSATTASRTSSASARRRSKRQLAEIEARGAVASSSSATSRTTAAPGEVLGILAVGDAMRAERAGSHRRAARAPASTKIVMLSGDNQRTASAIAKKAGIDEAIGDLLPDQKIERVHALLATSTYVGMIGDGVNDAPAMAAATVGIAMGAAGTDTAIETADMALMKDDLSKVAEAIALGRRTLGIIQFNIAFALALKAVFLVLALLGHTSLWLAILADTGATLLVIANALRLL